MMTPEPLPRITPTSLDPFSEDCVKLWEEGSLTPKLVAYDDGYGNATIAWGCTEGVFFGMKIDADQAEQMFKRELAKTAGILNRNIKRQDLAPWEYGAAFSFTFNEGARPTFFKAINSKNYREEVPALMMRYVYAKNKHTGKMERSEGLVHRRTLELQLWHGTYQDARITTPAPWGAKDVKEARYAGEPGKKPSRAAIATLAGLGVETIPTNLPDIPQVPDGLLQGLDKADTWSTTVSRISDHLGDAHLAFGARPLLLGLVAFVAVVLYLRSRTKDPTPA